MKRTFITLAMIGSLASLLLGLMTSSTTQAVTGSDWRAGRIIDDSIFYDNQSMSLSDIQNFLNNKTPTCDTQGTQSAADVGYPNMNHAQYAASRGWPGPPYVCLKDYYQVPRSDAVVNNFSGSIPAGAISAAQIIKAAADTYGISPKVLLATLQKESPGPLITDNWPLQSQYRNAMGYGCPDTAPCDPAYEGFYNQMTNAARQFKIYQNNPGNFRYKPLQDNSIYFNPNASCGASTVYLENYATAGLYNYTPYQPNQAALNNLYGSGDGCSAYGNRNFWRIYNDWFGSTSGVPYAARYVRQSDYPTIARNSSRTVFVDMKNIGNRFWKDQTTSFPGAPAIKVATANFINRGSPFQDASWPGYNRPTATLSKVYEADGTTLAQDQHTVFPGQIGRYEFVIKTYSNTPETTFQQDSYQLVAEGDPNWDVQGSFFFFNVTINDNLRKASYSSQSSYPSMNSGTSKSIYVEYKNNGSALWKDQTTSFPGAPAIKVATATPVNRSSQFQDTSWSSSSRPTATLSKVYEADGTTLAQDQHTVFPGQIGRYEFVIKVPQTLAAGTYREWFQLVAEGDPNWDVQGSQVFLDITVLPTPGLSYVSQSSYPTIARGNSTQVFFRYKNTGNLSFNSTSPVSHTDSTTTLSFATSSPINRSSQFSSNDWTSQNRPKTAFTSIYKANGSPSSDVIVKPGEDFVYQFTLSVPNSMQAGTYREWFQPIREGNPSYSIGGLSFLDITVQ